MPKAASPNQKQSSHSRKSQKDVLENPRFIVVTGLSGSGKSQVQKCLEDLGYFCIDNLPLGLVPEWGRLWKRQKQSRTALILDVREKSFWKDFGRIYAELQQLGVDPHLLFLESDDAVLIRRFSETRRPHPLARAGELLRSSIARERKLLQGVRNVADDVINTSRHTVHQLRKLIFEKYGRRQSCLLSIISFGYRFGIPPESDLVVDVRILPQPLFQSAFESANRTRWKCDTISSFLWGDTPGAREDPGFSTFPAAALCRGGQELPHDFFWLHRWQTSLGVHGAGD